LKKIYSSVVAIILVVAPLCHLFRSLFESHDQDIFDHVLKYDLPRAIETTTILTLSTVTLSLLMGISLAALVSFFDFPGRKIFSLAFIMPLTIPTYVMSFIYIGLFDFSGPIQSWLREEQWSLLLSILPNIRSLGGSIWVFSLCLYPYIYLLSCGAFRSLSKQHLESSKMLGASNTRTLYKVIIPMAFPWVFSGAILVSMETIADFGGVSAFNLTTFTTMIYKSWFGLGSFSTASSMSIILCLPALILIWLQAILNRRKKKFYSHGSQSGPQRKTLRGINSFLALAGSFVFTCFTLWIPLTQLMLWASKSNDHQTVKWENMASSLIQAIGSALLLILIVLPLIYAKRYLSHWMNQRMVDLCLLGYGLPGTVLAVAIFRWISSIDDALEPYDYYLGGTLLALYLGMASRYLSVAFYPIENQIHRITPSMDQASRMLGHSPFKTFLTVHIPIIKRSIGSAFVLVFVDVMKEMPMTLMMRPLGWNTLSVKIFEFTSEGDWEHAAIPSMIIIAFGIIPLIYYKKYDGQ
jgi:iron(III) transport system permease protein